MPVNRSSALTAFLTASLAFGLQACTTATAQDASVASTTPTVAGSGPALWKVADEDTTIYLFGTVHALPKDVDWMRGDLAEALATSQTLVTEIAAEELADPAVQQKTMAMATLPEGTTLRSLLDPEQTAAYQTALTGLGLPAAAFDRLEPWMAGMTLSLLPMTRAGYAADTGVEKGIEARIGPQTPRVALETVASQLGMFDSLPMDAQVTFLMTTVDMIDEIAPTMDAMVAEWLEGDADTLAELMNRGLADPELADALLYKRNRDWVEWIERRMDEPGTVFMAVGAGHLAGRNSVQDYLMQRGITVTRVQ